MGFLDGLNNLINSLDEFGEAQSRNVYCPSCGAFMFRLEYRHDNGTNTCPKCKKRIRIRVNKDYENKTIELESAEISPFQ